MPSLDELLAKRTKVKEASTEPTKVRALAKAANEGQLSGFHGLFKEPTLSASEEELLLQLLTECKKHASHDIDEDLIRLKHITREVKAIHIQAILLHGERIKQAEELLRKYKEGAFTRWLLAAYGNRQTPYNFLHFYEFFQLLPPELKKRAEALPRQAVYTLATRNGSVEAKHQFLVDCTDKTKRELLEDIREQFPLEKGDKRGQKWFSSLAITLGRIEKEMRKGRASFTSEEQAILLEKTKRIISLLVQKD